MSTSTPILPCEDHTAIIIHPSASPGSSKHPMQSPTFTIPPSIQPHLKVASDHLHSGQTVAVPTETVYGLAANSLNPEAVKRIYTIKNRPSDNPLIVHVSSLDMLQRLLPPPERYTMSKLYIDLIRAFWPGPLTLLFPTPNPPPDPAPQTTAIRMPSHPLALALIHYADLPLSAPSANTSGRPSPTCAQHVYNDLKGAEGLGCILDGGDCGVGVESTVVNGLKWVEGGGGFVDVLRPGGLRVEEIQRIVSEVDGNEGLTRMMVHGKSWQRNAEASSSRLSPLSIQASQENGEPSSLPSAPGLKYRHYSPRIPVFLLLPSTTFPNPPPSISTRSNLLDVVSTLAKSLQRNGKRPKFGLCHYDNSPLLHHPAKIPPTLDINVIPISLGPNAETAAQRLFSSMLQLEGVEMVDAILIEGCLEEGLGLAVMERIGKAVGGGGERGNLGEATLDGEGEGNNTFWVDVGVVDAS